MLLSNLGNPAWIALPCEKKTLFFTFCSLKQDFSRKFELNTSIEDKLFHCHSGQILLHEKCYLFVWFSHLNFAENVCKQNSGRHMLEKEIKSLKTIFNAVSSTVQFPFVVGNISNYYTFRIQKKYSKLIIEKQSEADFDGQGCLICKCDTLKKVIGINLFHCQRGGYISSNSVCNEAVDCPNDQSDEDFCKVCKETDLTNCNYTTMPLHKNYCKLNFYVGLKGKCKKFNSLNSWEEHSNTHEAIQISNNKNINILSPSKENPGLFHLCKPFEILCGKNTLYCYNITDLCQYKLKSNGSIVPCKNGNHLENCMLFECSSMFKCVKSYCVPWPYICDGKWDCPEGDDELHNHVCIGTHLCQSMYKCKSNKHTCLSISKVCDQETDCPDGDDEFYCNLSEVICPSNCYCLMYAITCKRTLYNIILANMNAFFISVHFSDSYVTSLTRFKMKLDLTYVIKLPRNNIELNCPICFFRNALILDLGYNSIKEIQKKCFSESKFLIIIAINDNKILHLHPYSLYDLRNLSFLNLSNNPLINLPTNSFMNLHNLKVVLFKNIQFEHIEDQPFTSSDVRIIVTDDYRVSCISPKGSFSSSYPPWYLSCSDILPGTSLKNIYITVSVFIIFFNIVSTVLQISIFKENKAFSLTVIAINFNDCLCGLYLCIIWVSDLIFHGTYLIKENMWKSHPLCFIAFFLILYFSLLGLFLLLFLSVSRLMVVLYPVDTKFKLSTAVIHYLGCIYAFTFIIILIFMVIFIEKESLIPTSLCQPFVDPTGKFLLIKIISWFVALSQSSASVAMVTMYIVLVKTVKESTEALGSLKNLNKINTTLIGQLIVTSLSNILCWFPTNVVYLSAMFLRTYPIHLVIWTTVIILPLNSIINPIIFLFRFTKR